MFGDPTKLIRDQIKRRVFTERSPFGTLYLMCELCGETLASDLHEIINRAMIPTDMLVKVPPQYLSCLCNHCNVEHGDTQWARRFLIAKNADCYGLIKMVDALQEFTEGVQSVLPITMTELYGMSDIAGLRIELD